MSLIHYIFDTYVGVDYKLLIHKEGSTDEDRNKLLSIELIMISRMEDYFVDVLLSPKFRQNLCNAACKRGYVNTLKWAREHGCDWDSYTCTVAAMNGHLNCLQWAREHGCPWNRNDCLSLATSHEHSQVVDWINSTAN